MRTILLFLSLAFVFSNSAWAQQISTLEWYSTLGSYSSASFSYCDQEPNPNPVSLRFTYQHCLGGEFDCIEEVCSNPMFDNNRFKAVITLLRDGTPLEARQVGGENPNFQVFFTAPIDQSGNYRVEVVLNKRRENVCVVHDHEQTSYSNTIVVSSIPNTTSFNINGLNINNSPLTVCESNITINAANSNCEDNYYIAVEESDQYWNRTFEYEWGAWLVGPAPNGIDLQYASQFIPSIDPSTYTGTDASRRSERLKGGTLSSGADRYYRVKVCTGPTWNCKYALIKVNPNCRVDPNAIITDNNTYVLVDDNEATVKNGASPTEVKPNHFNIVQEPTAQITIAPNPFQQTTTVSVEGYTGKAPLTFELYNSLGQRVLAKQSNQATFEIERGNLAAGIYVYRATAGETVLGTGKLSIQ